MFQTLSCIFETINQEVQSSIDATYSTGLTGSLANDISQKYLYFMDFDALRTINQEVQSSKDTTNSTGLTGSLANDISQNYLHFMDLDAKCIMYSYLKDDYLRAIHAVT